MTKQMRDCLSQRRYYERHPEKLKIHNAYNPEMTQQRKLQKQAATRRSLRKRMCKLRIMAGGKCALCGYCRCHSALEFHHLDPNKKLFGIAAGAGRVSLEESLEECKKCILLCSNCHREVEEGLVTLEGVKNGIAT
jgi:5-methylcytosine-specific restriction endonuclease McrA